MLIVLTTLTILSGLNNVRVGLTVWWLLRCGRARAAEKPPLPCEATSALPEHVCVCMYIWVRVEKRWAAKIARMTEIGTARNNALTACRCSATAVMRAARGSKNAPMAKLIFQPTSTRSLHASLWSHSSYASLCKSLLCVYVCACKWTAIIMSARWRMRKTFNSQQFNEKRELFAGNNKSMLLNMIIFFC